MKQPLGSDEDHDSSDDEHRHQRGPVVFEETPRKERSGNKSFTTLFNEDDPLTRPNFSLATSQPRPASSDEDDYGDSAQALPRAQAQTQPRTRKRLKPPDIRADTREKAFNISSRLTSSKGSNFLDQDPRTLRSISASASSSTKSNPSTAPSTPDRDVSKLPPTSSAPTSDAEMDENPDSSNDGKNKLNLVPVSPPPPSLKATGGYGNANTKGRGKWKTGFTSGAGKWKSKGKGSAQASTWTFAGDDSQDEDLDDGGLPVVRTYQVRNATSKVGGGGELLDDFHSQEGEITRDLVSCLKRRVSSSDPDLSFFPSQVQPQDGDMVVNLREEFRAILDLNTNAAPLETAAGGMSAGGKGEYMRHARVVRAVRDGTRVIGMFDPSRGGHIWGVGETEREADADLGTEDFQLGGGDGDYDDWEGEGVPWEVAELDHDDDETRS